MSRKFFTVLAKRRAPGLVSFCGPDMTFKGPFQVTVSPSLDDTLTLAHFQQIGRIAAYWSYAETQVEYIIWGLLNVSPGHGLAITADMRIWSRIKSARVLAQDVLGDGPATELGAILTRLEDQEQHRNRLIRHRENEDAGGMRENGKKQEKSGREETGRTPLSTSIGSQIAPFDICSEM